MSAHHLCLPRKRLPLEVATIHRVGVWALSVSAEGGRFAVTHVPTGAAAEYCQSQEEGREIVDALGDACPDYYEGAPFGRQLPADNRIPKLIDGIAARRSLILTRPKVQP